MKEREREKEKPILPTSYQILAGWCYHPRASLVVLHAGLLQTSLIVSSAFSNSEIIISFVPNFTLSIWFTTAFVPTSKRFFAIFILLLWVFSWKCILMFVLSIQIILKMAWCKNIFLMGNLKITFYKQNNYDNVFWGAPNLGNDYFNKNIT